MKVPDLKAELRKRGLVIGGKKVDLVTRLVEDDAKSQSPVDASLED